MLEERVEQKISKSDLEFRCLLEKLPAAAYLCDASGLITYYNRHAIALWGRAPALNDPVDRFCGSFKLFSIDGIPIPRDKCWMALALSHGKEYNGEEIIIERPDGSRWTALAHANPFFDEAGKVCGAVNVLVDISDRRRTEEVLRQADRNKNDFLAMLAHELRNPLAPLRNGLQIMQLSNNNSAMAAEACKMMERQIGNMVRLIDDLLDLSRISKGKFELRKEKIDLRLVVQDALETSRPLIEGARHQLSVVMPTQPVFVNADRVRLAQVFANLLNNSAKYTERGGQISLIVERQGTDAVVKVKDNGMGISPAVLPKVFDLFTQADRSLERSQSGLGIGLSVVRGLVDMHGGIVEAASEGLGKGSEFIVRLSTVVSPALEAEQKDGGNAYIYAPSKYRILVVDDNKDAAISLAMMLKIMGHDTRTAHDGVEAVEAAQTFLPDVIMLDIGLPKLNGYDVCRRIRGAAWGKDMILIAVTGWSQEEDKRQSKEAGFNFHMLKPVDPQAVVKLLTGLLLTPA